MKWHASSAKKRPEGKTFGTVQARDPPPPPPPPRGGGCCWGPPPGGARAGRGTGGNLFKRPLTWGIPSALIKFRLPVVFPLSFPFHFILLWRVKAGKNVGVPRHQAGAVSSSVCGFLRGVGLGILC